MRKFAFLLFAVVFMMSFQLAYAIDSDDIERSGSVRIRSDFASNMGDFFDETTGPPAIGFDDEGTFFPYRVRFALGVNLPREMRAFLEIDTNDAGNVFGSALPGPDENGIDFYQAYLKFGDFFDLPIDVTFGRQELVFGDEFIFGDNDFYEGLSWDGVRVDFNAGRGNWSLFAMEVTEASPVAPLTSTGSLAVANDNTDRIVWGGYTVWDLATDNVLDLYAFIDNNNADSTVGPPIFDNVLTVGARFARDPGGEGFDYKAEVALQQGDRDVFGVEADSGGLAFDGRIGYSLDRHWFALMYTQFEGDDNPGDADIDVFLTPWQDIHGRFGNMDVLKWSVLGTGPTSATRLAFWERSTFGLNPAAVATDTATFGINIIQLRYAMLVNDEWDWGVNLLRFDTDADAPGVEDDLGNELDFYVNHVYSEHVAFTLNLSFFSAGDLIDDVDFPGVAPPGDGIADGLGRQATTGSTADDATRIYLNTVLTF